MKWAAENSMSRGLLGEILRGSGQSCRANTKSGFEAVERRQDTGLFATQKIHAF
jgi:hypothetical protein